LTRDLKKIKKNNERICAFVIRYADKARRKTGKSLLRCAEKAFDRFNGYADLGGHEFMPDNYPEALGSLKEIFLRLKQIQPEQPDHENVSVKIRIISILLRAEGLFMIVKKYEALTLQSEF